MSALSRNVWDTVSSPGVVFSAGVNTNNLTAVTFSNSNGVSFGLNAGVVTASMSGGAGGGAALQGSGTFTQNTGTIQFANSNGVSFGLTNGQMTATVATNYAGTGFTSATTAGTDVVGTLATNGISIGVPAYLTTYVNDLTSGRAGINSAITGGLMTLNTSGLSVDLGGLVSSISSVSTAASEILNYSPVFVSWQFNTTNNTGVDPGTGFVSFDDVPANASFMAISLTDANGIFRKDFINVFTKPPTVRTFACLTFSKKDHPEDFFVVNIVGAPSKFANYWLFPVSGITSSGFGSIVLNDFLIVSVQYGDWDGNLHAGTGFTSTTTSGTALVGTQNTSGLSLGVPAFLTTAMQSNAGTISNIKVSAGTLSANRSDITFSNSNGVGFGLNTNGVITASYTVPTVTNSSWTVSDSATSATVARLAFVNSNGVTFGLSTSNNGNQSISASYTVPTITNSSWTVSDSVTSATVGQLAFVNSNNVSFALSTSNNGQQTIKASIATTYAGTGFTSTTTAGTAVVGTLNTSGLSLGIPVFLTTSPAVTNSSWTVSDSATSATVGRLAFTASNGLTLSLSTSNNGNHTVIGSYTVPNVPAATSWTVSDSATSATVARLMFSNANGVSFGLITSNNGSQSVTASIATTYAGTGFTSTTTAGTAIVGTNNTSGLSLGVPAFLTTAAQTGQTLGFSLGGNSGTTNSSQISNGGYVLAGGSNVTILQSNNTISIAAASAAASPVNISAGTASANLASIVFANANGITFGLNTGASSQSITASFIPRVAISNSQTLFSSGTVALSEGGGAITIASSAGGQSLMFSVPQTSSLAGASGISISTNGSTITVYNALAPGTLSYWHNIQEIQGTSSFSLQSNSVNVQPFLLPYVISCSYIRIPVSFANLTSTTVGFTAGSSSFYYYQSINAVIYSQGGGANSRSLQYLTSAQAAFTEAFLFSISNAGTNESIAYQITYPVEGNNTNNSATTMLTTAGGASIFLHTTGGMTNFTGIHHLDIPFANSLSAGNYWIAFNRSTSSTTSGGGIAITNNVNRAHTLIGVTQINSNFVPLGFASAGAATASTQPVWQIGLGSHSVSAQGATTSSLALSSISSVANFPVIPMQFIRQA